MAMNTPDQAAAPLAKRLREWLDTQSENEFVKLVALNLVTRNQQSTAIAYFDENDRSVEVV
jgi:hypothetical protein